MPSVNGTHDHSDHELLLTKAIEALSSVLIESAEHNQLKGPNRRKTRPQ
jgi:hypothetical protein